MPFTAVSWPAGGSACLEPGYASRIGRISAPDAKTVVFTLCLPDGAFPQRLAHPSLGIVDAGDLARIAASPAAARDVAGHGAYRIARWGEGNVELARVGSPAAGATETTVILRWEGDAAARSAALVAGTVDGIDAPSAAGLEAAATDPALTVVPRPGLATAVLGFGRGVSLSEVKVRRAFAGAIDRDTLATDAFPSGSVAADHLAPCEVPSGCSGPAFPGFNAPAAVAALAAAKFDLEAAITLTIPDAALPGLPDPARVAAAVRDQLAANLGLTVEIATLPSAEFRATVDDGSLEGLYLDGVATEVADPSAFYGPLLVDNAGSLAARRADGVAAALTAAADTGDPDARDAAFTDAATAARDTASLVPLAHAGGTTVFLADVRNATASPLGTDPLGAMTAGDRGQMTFLGTASPGGGWCGAQPDLAAYRLCGLVTDGLYAHVAGSLDATPRLVSACTPNADATRWTCRLRTATTADGRTLDAADVVATFRAMGDPADPVHRAIGDGAFSAWDALFGLAPGSIPAPTPSPTLQPSPTPQDSGSASPAASGAGSPAPSRSPKPSASTSPTP